jgi:protein gp37
MAARLKAMGQAKYQNDGDPRTSGPGFAVTTHPDALDIPLNRRKPATWFVNSMSDLFHARVPKTFVGSVWNTIAITPQHTYQILTKRPERMRRILSEWAEAGWMWRKHDLRWCGPLPGPLPNVWLGTSIESDEYTYRADELRETPAAIRFLSLEPLLGPLPSLRFDGIDWVIIGGESGRNARPMEIDWVRALIAEARGAGTAVFVKQLGSVTGADWGAGPKGGDWTRWPSGIRFREFPRIAEPVSA